MIKCVGRNVKGLGLLQSKEVERLTAQQRAAFSGSIAYVKGYLSIANLLAMLERGSSSWSSNAQPRKRLITMLKTSPGELNRKLPKNFIRTPEKNNITKYKSGSLVHLSVQLV